MSNECGPHCRCSWQNCKQLLADIPASDHPPSVVGVQNNDKELTE